MKIVQESNWRNAGGVYAAKLRGLNATPINTTTQANIVANLTHAETAEEKATRLEREEAARLSAQTTSANNYHAIVNSFRGTVSEADMALCLANVNPFSPAQVSVMQSCLQSKVAPVDGGGAGTAPTSEPGESPAQTSGGIGSLVTTTNLMIGGGILLVLLISYFGYRYYKKSKTATAQ